jgi:glycosyltransferase involved in cell wall biosynthesis
MISIIIPAYNEEGNVAKLHSEIVKTLSELKKSFEIIFIDDGSTDNTFQNLKQLSPAHIIRFRKNFGQTSGFDAGIKASKGDIIITMDADGQNDPKDIPRIVEKLESGFDVVSGWRKKRHDPMSKRFLSGGANALRKIFVKDGIHDSGCSLKAFRRECFENLDLYGEIHRFIPGILSSKGFKIGEIIVNHRPRTSGKTKYNLTRTVKGFLDMLGIWFWKNYSARPIHLFGGIGLILSFTGTLIIIALFFLRLFNIISLSNSIWPFAGFFLIIIGMQLFISGLMADISSKNYYRSHKTNPYSIKETFENQ